MDFTIVCIRNHVHNTLIVCIWKKISVNKIVLNKETTDYSIAKAITGVLVLFL